MSTESRLVQVENELADVTTRLRRLEGEMEAPEPPPLLNWGQPPRQVRAEIDVDKIARRRTGEPEVHPQRSVLDLEALFGGRVLAWIGGLAILFAAVLFLGMAISRGWLDEETRTIVGGAFALLGLVGGVWLYERRGRTDAAQAGVAGSLAGLFGTIVVATQVYDLIPAALGLGLGAAVAAAGFALAVRWRSPLIGALGSLGALAMPLLVGEGETGLAIAFLALALVATVGILIWQRWDWLALGAFLLSAPQLLAWVNHEHDPHLVLTLLVMAGFWALYAGAAFGYELRRRAEETLPVSSWILLFGSCAVFAGPAYLILDSSAHHAAAVVLLFGFGALQVALGIAAIRLRLHRELGALLVGIGIGLGAIGIGVALHGPALVCGWAAAGVVLAMLGSRLDATPGSALSDAQRMLLAAYGFVALAIGHTLIVEAPPSALFDGLHSWSEASAAIVACAVASFSWAALARRALPEAVPVAAFAGAIALVYLGSVLIVDDIGVYGFGETRQSGQAWLSAFWAVTAITAIVVGLQRRLPAVRFGGLALLAVAIVKVWTYDLAELDELSRVLSFVGLGLLLLVGSYAYARIKPRPEEADPTEATSPSDPSSCA